MCYCRSGGAAAEERLCRSVTEFAISRTWSKESAEVKSRSSDVTDMSTAANGLSGVNKTFRAVGDEDSKVVGAVEKGSRCVKPRILWPIRVRWCGI